MKLSTVPKKSLAAAVCAALNLLWSGGTALVFSATEIYLKSELSVYDKVMGLILPLLASALYLWFLIPNNRRYRGGLKVILSLLVAHHVVTIAMSIDSTIFDRANIGKTALGLLNLLLSAFAILLFGAFANKRTEKLAALAMVAWSLAKAVGPDWKIISENLFANAGLLLVILLSALLMAAPIWLHPVLERPILQTQAKDKEEEVHI